MDQKKKKKKKKTWVSKYSKVFGISRMDLTPAQTTVTFVLPNSVKSALTSKVVSAPLWTPPRKND